MFLSLVRKSLCILVCSWLCTLPGYAQNSFEEEHTAVALRMIGHRILLNSNDSVSRVLPIKKSFDHYRIEFETEFEFVPEELVATVNEVAQEAGLNKSYIVEVEECVTGDVVYSFEMSEPDQTEMAPCLSRALPKSCYSLVFKFTGLGEPIAANHNDHNGVSAETRSSTGQFGYIPIGLLVLITSALLYFLFKSRQKSKANPNLIRLGESQFDKRNTRLLIDQKSIELSSKEGDLLLLLYYAANTVERERILNTIWGDNGDYVGRTLDVFISKLRKKLEADSKVKIVNIRGIGYKLVLDV